MVNCCTIIGCVAKNMAVNDRGWVDDCDQTCGSHCSADSCDYKSYPDQLCSGSDCEQWLQDLNENSRRNLHGLTHVLNVRKDAQSSCQKQGSTDSTFGFAMSEDPTDLETSGDFVVPNLLQLNNCNFHWSFPSSYFLASGIHAADRKTHRSRL